MAVESQPVKAFADGRMDTHNAALYVGLSSKTLAMKRCTGNGPLFVKRGRIYYFKADLDAWLNEQGRLVSTAQSKPQHPTH